MLSFGEAVMRVKQDMYPNKETTEQQNESSTLKKKPNYFMIGRIKLCAI